MKDMADKETEVFIYGLEIVDSYVLNVISILLEFLTLGKWCIMKPDSQIIFFNVAVIFFLINVIVEQR